ncbi:MAG: tetratricopeptide repeat protein [Acidobacteriota bacterium]
MSLLHAHKYHDATSRLERIIATWSDDYHAHVSLGIAYTQLGRLQEAGQAFQSAVRLNPTSAKAHNNLGANYLEQNKPAEAAKEFRQATSLEPANTAAWFNLGICLLRAGQEAKAEEALLRAAELSGKDFQILLVLADAQFRANKPQSALTTIDRTKQFIAGDAKALLSVAVLLLRNGKGSLASDYFGRARSSFPEISGWVLTMAGLSMDQSDYETALSLLEWVKDSNQDSAIWHNLVGYSHFKLGQIEPALNHLQKAIHLDPIRENHYLDLGELLGETNAGLALVPVFESGIRVLPGSTKIRLGLAVAHLLTGNLDRAQQEVEIVLTNDPTSEVAYRILLESYDKGMQWSEMRDAAERLRHLNDGNPVGWYYGAKSEYQLGVASNESLDVALKCIRRRVELGPPDLKTYFLLGKILMAEKQEQEAVVALQKATELSNEDPRPFYVLARLLQRLGRNEEARVVMSAQRVAKARQDANHFDRLLVDVRPARHEGSSVLRP